MDFVETNGYIDYNLMEGVEKKIKTKSFDGI